MFCFELISDFIVCEMHVGKMVRFQFQIHHKEKQKTEEFNLLDKAERDLFILLQAAVKTSHEKEKIHTNSAKYWSIVGSLAGNLMFD